MQADLGVDAPGQEPTHTGAIDGTEAPGFVWRHLAGANCPMAATLARFTANRPAARNCLPLVRKSCLKCRAMHPQRPRLAELVSRELVAGMEARRWVGWLPRERNLADELHVSRSTLRQALRLLRGEGLLETLHSRGNRIISSNLKRRGNVKRPVIVNLVVPGATWRLPRVPVNWLDELRAQLATKGCQLQVLHAEQCYSRRPQRALEQLLRRNPADCWLFRLSTLPLQQLLERHEIPVILTGTAYPEVNLPYIDVDYRALSRHAAGMVIAAGHTRIDLVIDSDSRAGDIEVEAGFREAVRSSGLHPDLQANVLRYEYGVPGVIRLLSNLLRRSERPTALLVSYAAYCMTIWSYLGSRGFCVPRDISVVALQGPPELMYLTPEPTYYRLNVQAYVRKLIRLIMARIDGNAMQRQTTILPDFVRGASLARPRS